MILLALAFCVVGFAAGQSTQGLDVAFPEKWEGDRYKNAPMSSQGIPPWIDGFFFCQTSASYGKASDGLARSLVHMFDGLGAVAQYHLSGGDVRFSAAYYPYKLQKIWEFYNRDMAPTGAAFAGLSPKNNTLGQKWTDLGADILFPINPNVDFWKIGKDVVGGTEFPRLGFRFNVSSLENMEPYPFSEQSEQFRPNSSLSFLNMPIHERVDSSGTLWSSVAAIDFRASKSYQVVFTVSPQGQRTVQGMYEFGNFDPNQCAQDGTYRGNKRVLSGYMHSITSTENYVIMPLSSSLLVPCRVPPNMVGNGVEMPAKFNFDREMPLRYLIFNKQTRQFLPIISDQSPGWPSHQFNAYEKDGKLLMDMIWYDDIEAYNEYLKVEYLKRTGIPRAIKPVRVEIDLQTQRATKRSLTPEQQMSIEFSQFNHKYEGKPYRWGYALVWPFMAGSELIKIDMDDPSGRNNLRFSAGQNMAFSEPWFIPRPNAAQEDDGVLIARAIDVTQKAGLLFIVDAKTMQEVGRARAPLPVPFGFHNRYYSKEDLGIVSRMSSLVDLMQYDTVWQGLTNRMSSMLDSITSNTGNVQEKAKNQFCGWFGTVIQQFGVDWCMQPN